MSKTEIIIAILSSSVISASLTSYINWRIHNSNYKKDYYRKILDKRLEAYESINKLINRLSDIVYVDRNVVHALLCSSESFDFITSQFHLAMENRYWFAEGTANKLTEFGAFLFNEISGHIDDTLPEETRNEKYIELGIKHFDKISEFKQTLKFSVNSDLKNLYKIDAFFNGNGKDSTQYPIYEKAINN